MSNSGRRSSSVDRALNRVRCSISTSRYLTEVVDEVEVSHAAIAAALLALRSAPTALSVVPPTGGHAVQSKLAAEALLLGVARAGKRIVAVGEYGNILLSDDDGKTWHQAKDVPTTVTLTAVALRRRQDRLGGRPRHGDPAHDRRRRDVDQAIRRRRERQRACSRSTSRMRRSRLGDRRLQLHGSRRPTAARPGSSARR